MSHDRGCFKCGREQWEYRECAINKGPKCVKYDWIFPIIQKPIPNKQSLWFWKE